MHFLSWRLVGRQCCALLLWDRRVELTDKPKKRKSKAVPLVLRPGRPPRQAAAPARPTAAKRRKKASPKVVRARKLQGQYLGALKSLTGTDRAKVKTVAKEKGVAEALKLAASLKPTT
jgi:hypothetical protein